jgi:hypothetical protein
MLVKRAWWASLIALVLVGLAGCGQSTSVKLNADHSPATTAADAAGGIAAWRQCRQFEAEGVVTAYGAKGGLYLTEHTFRVSPWSHAISISAREPQGTCVWELVGHQFRWTEGQPGLDVSPLRNEYADYAEAVLEIMTAPVRLQEWGSASAVGPATLMIGGLPYFAIEAGSAASVERVYFQDGDSSRVDMIWLADRSRARFVMVRGYDYGAISGAGVQIPGKIELFRSDAARAIGPRLAQVDIRR